MRLFGWKNKDLSHRILILLVTITVVMFALFYFVGYSHPYAENPDFIEPIFTNAILWLMLAMFLFAFLVAVWAIVTALTKRGRGQKVVNKVPVAVISTTVVIMTTVIMGFSFLLGSSSAVNVNGQNFENSAWLKATDMFVISSLVLMTLAAALVAFASIRSYINRK